MKTQALATKLPLDLKRNLDWVCEKLGLKKNHVIEMALREKLEDLIDAHDLKTSIRQATGYHDWNDFKPNRKKSR